MSKVYTHFANVLWSAKLLTGPTSASPGPTLLSVAATALMDVTMSCPLRLTASAEAPHIMKYMAMKLAAEVTIEGLAVFLPWNIATTAFGWIILFSSAIDSLMTTWKRTHLIAPAVEPAQPPTSMRASRRSWVNIGHSA